MAGVRERGTVWRWSAFRGRAGISTGFRPDSAVGRGVTAGRGRADAACTRCRYAALQCWPDAASDRSDVVG